MKIAEKFSELPVAEIAEKMCVFLDKSPRLVITAPPGAGKSTLLPLVLMENIPEGKILMLEPRRIAARQVAERMAAMVGERVGGTVGYRVRFDTKVSPRTRLEVITEGILERMLIEDPTLEGVEALFFDEFHERSLSSDLSLALTREIQNVLRPELKIIVMSATIDASNLSKELDARSLHSSGKLHDVEIVYGEDYDIKGSASEVASTVRTALRNHEGDILAFLPGQAEIQKCQALLEGSTEGIEILTLYGMMNPADQRRVLGRSDRSKRRVVLATPIAETSLTIEGISVVVDSGLYRTPVFEPTTGLSRLTTARISLDMATQRSGRAGRLGPGTCYRLWSRAAEHRMKDTRQPEIESADLSSLLLAVTMWGEADPLRLPWVTTPPAGHLADGRRLLMALGAINEEGRLTEKGKRIAGLPCHPRIASMLIEAGEKSGTACDVAALLEEKDPLNDETDADLSTRVYMLGNYRRRGLTGVWKRIEAVASQYRRLTKSAVPETKEAPEVIGNLVGAAYPERIAMNDGKGRYRLATGGGSVTLHPDDNLARYDYLAVASMGSRIFLAAPIAREDLQQKRKWVRTAIWNGREGRAIVREELRLGLLTLSTKPIEGDTGPLVIEAIAAAAPKEGLTIFDFNDEVENLQKRIEVASGWHPELGLPDVSTETILRTTKEWLPMYIGKASTLQELRKIDIASVIFGMLSYEQQQTLDRIVPTHISLPSGRRARIHYRRGAEAPIVSARLQDCFGLTKTPLVDEGKRPVLMELLSPGFKPVQLTQDMEGFWRTTYFEVRKELRRRYPKHKWPEDPLNPTVNS